MTIGAGLVFAGASHRVADVASREAFARRAAAIAGGAWPGPAPLETLVLATCHRAELYVVTPDPEAFASALAHDAGAPEIQTGESAVRRLCRVACGLDSLVLGEAEISGQIRRAAATARAAGTLGPLLERVVAGALAASGRARTETAIATGATSVSSAGVALAERVLGGLDGRSAVVIGAGEAGRLALQRLARARDLALTIVSRSARHAHAAAARSAPGARVAGLDALPAALASADLAIAAVAVDRPIVTREAIDAAARARGGRALVLVDLSVPRAIAPDAADVPHVVLRTVDDLGDVVAAAAARRRDAVPDVEAIAAAEARRAFALFQARVSRARAAIVA